MQDLMKKKKRRQRKKQAAVQDGLKPKIPEPTTFLVCDNLKILVFGMNQEIVFFQFNN